MTKSLIREVRKRRDGAVESYDREISAATLKIGSGADQDLQLEGSGIAPAHATIRVGSGSSQLKCLGKNRVLVAAQRVARAELAPDTEVTLGSHRLRVIAPPGGFSLALEVHFGDGLAAQDFEKAFDTRLDQTWLRRRPLAWTAVLLIAALFLIVPLWKAQQRNHGKPLGAAFALLPGDRSWSAGPLIAAHQQAIGDNCGACHKRLFQPVQDASCSECHRTVHDHVAPEHLQLTRFSKTTPSCESCHREHNRIPAAIIDRSDRLCVSCHGKDTAAFGTLGIQTVRGFDAQGHPKFKIHLLKPAADDPLAGTPDAQWQSVAVELAGAEESSNLIFSHKQHLDPARVAASTHDGALACGDCHVANADGLRFQPVTMRTACISCHELSFDPLEPRRQLPHGKPREVVATIEEFYARRYLEPNSVAAASFTRRETPGEADKVDAIRCTDSAAVCAHQSAVRAIESQFKVRGCRSCHQISDNQNKDIAERFGVLAVKLGNEFYPQAKFKHSSHLIQNGLTGDAACKSCHAAQQSETAEQVLIPGISTCLNCHSDATVDTRGQRQLDAQRDSGGTRRSIVPLGCIGCHGYHPLDVRNPIRSNVLANGP